MRHLLRKAYYFKDKALDICVKNVRLDLRAEWLGRKKARLEAKNTKLFAVTTNWLLRKWSLLLEV